MKIDCLAWIRRNVPIAQVAGELGLVVRGNAARCWRPSNHVNGDKHPSLGFTSQNKFKCFVCDRRPGSNVDLVMLVRSLNISSAIRWFRQHYSGVPDEAPRRREPDLTRVTLETIVDCGIWAKLSDAQRAILVSLWTRREPDTGLVRLSYGRILELSGLASRKTITATIEHFEEQHLLEVQRADRRLSVYQFVEHPDFLDLQQKTWQTFAMCAKSVSSDDPNKLVASEGTSSECRSGSEDKNLVPSRGTRSEEKGKLVPLEGTGSPEPLYTGLSSPRGNQIYDFSEREQQVLRLAQRGFQLFPCKPRRKEPAIVNWRKLATADQKKLVHWFTEFPEANWAVATGPVSGVFVVDVDEAGAWSELCQRNGGAVETLSVRTTRGRHLYLRYPVESMICNSAKQIASGVDVRGQGGYALCPPSIHPSGTPYQWLGPESQPFAQPQSWLLDLIQQASGGMSGSKGSDCVEIVL